MHIQGRPRPNNAETAWPTRPGGFTASSGLRQGFYRPRPNPQANPIEQIECRSVPLATDREHYQTGTKPAQSLAHTPASGGLTFTWLAVAVAGNGDSGPAPTLDYSRAFEHPDIAQEYQ